MSTADELLLRLVDADAKIRPRRERFMVFWMVNAERPQIVHPGISEHLNWAAQDIEDLADVGHLRTTRTERGSIDGFDVTRSGFEHAGRLRRAESASAQSEPTSEHGAAECSL
jgi:hypothetical protein